MSDPVYTITDAGVQEVLDLRDVDDDKLLRLLGHDEPPRYLDPAKLPLNVPVVPKLAAQILERQAADPASFYMGDWHCTVNPDGSHSAGLGRDRECGTAHCLAGWAVHLAGKAGYKLEARLDPDDEDRDSATCAAGALIWAASHDGEVPNFYASEARALDWLRQAAAAPLP